MATELPLNELSTVFARINGLLLTTEKVDDALALLARAVQETTPESAGAGVTLIDSQGRKTSSGFTDPVVEKLDALQYETGQGPCLSAWASGRAVVVADVHSDSRWPDWSASVEHLPIRSVISTPLISNDKTLGALKAYSNAPAAYDTGTIELLKLFAGPAATLLSSIQASDAPQQISESLAHALRDRDSVSRACGVLMERDHITEDQAIRQLLDRARGENKTLSLVCADVLAGTQQG